MSLTFDVRYCCGFSKKYERKSNDSGEDILQNDMPRSNLVS